MMTALLLYAHAQGIYSSRRIAKACEERVDVMAVTGLARPDFRTINQFRKRHLEALADLFVWVLGLCRPAGLVRLGHVALDGGKIKANASKHKAMSYGRMVKAEAELAAEVDGWLRAAEAQDSAEEAEHGPEHRGDEPPEWMRDKQRRLAGPPRRRWRPRRRQRPRPKQPCPSAIEAGASPSMHRDSRSRRRSGTSPTLTAASWSVRTASSRPPTPRSRSMPRPRSSSPTDWPGRPATRRRWCRWWTRCRPIPTPRREVSADAGFCAEATLAAMAERGIKAYFATGRARGPAGDEAQRRGPQVAAMRAKLRRAGHRSRYRLRKQVVEPAFGQIKQARGFRQFLLRGLDKVRGEWALVCIAHNLLKLAQGRSLSALTPMPQKAGLAPA